MFSNLEHAGKAGIDFHCHQCSKLYKEGSQYWRKGLRILCNSCAMAAGWLAK